MQYIKDHIWKITALLSIVAFGLTRSIYVSEADVMWQIRSGLDFMADGVFFRPDTYSWTATGQEYISNSWLWNLMISQIYLGAGFYGVAAFTGLSVSVILALIVYTMRKSAVSWIAIFIVLAFIGVFSGVWLSGRPQIVDYFLLAFSMALLAKLNMGKKSSHIIVFLVFPIIIVAWNNFHLTGIVGSFCLAGLYFMYQEKNTAFAITKESFSSLLRSLALLGVLVASCLLTPYGVDGFTKPLITMGASAGLITEWLSPWTFNSEVNTLAAVAISGAIFVAVYLIKTKQWITASFSIGLIVISSWQSRWTPFMVIMLVTIIGHAIDKIKSERLEKYSIYFRTAAVAVAVTVFCVGLAAFIPQNRVSGGNYGYDLVSSIPEGCKIYNEPAIGGAIVLMRPDLKVSADGRNDMYGWNEYVEQSDVSYDVREGRLWLEKNGIGCVLLHEESPMNIHLSGNSEWKLAQEDSRGTKLWLKKGLGSLSSK